MSVNLPLPRLDDNSVCEHCVRGSHRMCRHPECECAVTNGGALSHTNRPKTRATRQGGIPMAATAPTPIRRDEPKKKGTPVPPKIGLNKIGDLPELVRSPKLCDRIVEQLAGADLEAGAWYELITYSSSFGSGGAATRLAKDDRLSAYEFAARGSIVYVRAAAAE